MRLATVFSGFLSFSASAAALALRASFACFLARAFCAFFDSGLLGSAAWFVPPFLAFFLSLRAKG